MRADFKFAIRSLVKTPTFTAVALLTLGLCIGANVVIFAVVDAIVLRSLPFPQPDRLVIAINSYPGTGSERSGASVADYYGRRSGIEAFASTSLYQPGRAIVGAAGATTIVDSDRVSPEFFATLGVPLPMGRTFNDDEMLPAGSRVAILTDAFWKKHFNADVRALGKTFQVDSQKVTVVGVLPRGFRYLSSNAQFFMPAASEPTLRKMQHVNSVYQVIARLAPGATLDIAQSQLDTLNNRLTQESPFAQSLKAARFHTTLYPLHADHVREVRPILLILQGGVLFLLLIGSANLINLLLIRAHAQSKELAIRQALGARSQHIARQTLAETMVLAIGGALLGLCLGAAGIQLLKIFGINQLPRSSAVALDGRVMAITLAASIAAGVALATPITWHQLKIQLTPVLQTEAHGGTGNRSAQRLRNGSIVMQVALAFILLSSAGLLGLSLQHVLDVPPGFRADRVLTGQLLLPQQNYPDIVTRQGLIDRLIDRLQAQPGVTAVGITTALPMTGNRIVNVTAVEGKEPGAGESNRSHIVAGIDGEYFEALGIPLRQGRFLQDADNRREHQVCVVDEEFARRYWPDQSPLGRRLSQSVKFNEQRACTIVGVVGNVKQESLAEPDAQGAIYVPYENFPLNQLSVVVQTPLAPEALAPMLKKAALQLDPELPIEQLKPMQVWVNDSLVARRSPALLAVTFAGVALLLAALGTYGVLAYAVGQRRREIGVRMALGAQPRQILMQFLGMSAKLLVTGLVIGALGAVFAGRALQGVLFGVSGFQGTILLATATVMTLVVLLATFIPSRRAARVDPLTALRKE